MTQRRWRPQQQKQQQRLHSPVPLSLLLLSLCLLLSHVSPTVLASCVVGDSTGFPECAGFGQCLHLNLTGGGSGGGADGGASDLRCLCKAQRYEWDGSASMHSTDPTCLASLSTAAPALFSGGRAMLGLLLACTGLLVLAPLVRLCCFTRPAARDTRFERITVASADLLRPTPGQLRHGRWALSIASCAVLLWIIDVAADPFGGESTLNDAGGYTLSLGADGRAVESGMKLRELLEDLSELCLFACYAFFFILFRKVVVPAPALLSGTRFIKDWSTSSSSSSDDPEKCDAAAGGHNVYVKDAQAERKRAQAEREAIEAQRESQGLPPDTHEERERKWAEEEEETLRRLREELAASDTEAQAAQRLAIRRQTMQRQHTQKFTRTARERASTLRGDNRRLPPPPPPLPPQVPAPAPVPSVRAPNSEPGASGSKLTGKSASKYVVAAETELARAHAPIVAPSGRAAATASAGAPVFSLDIASIRPPATGITDEDDEDGPRADSPSSSSSGSHSIRIDPSAEAEVAALKRTLAEMEKEAKKAEKQAKKMEKQAKRARKAEEDAGVDDLDPDAPTTNASVEVSAADLLSFPVPNYLIGTFVFQMVCGLLLVAALPLAHVVLHERLVFTVLLWVCYLLMHLVYLWYLLTFWSPYYLISLKEDLLAEAGMPLPMHRRVVASATAVGGGFGAAGSAPQPPPSSSTSTTLHFGMRTAYELSKLHSLYLYCMTGAIVLALVQSCLCLFQSYALSTLPGPSNALHADSSIILFMFNRLAQCVRVAGVVVLFYPFQIVIQYQTLQNFWLDGKLHWGRNRAQQRAVDEAQSALPPDQLTIVQPQLVQSDIEEEEKKRAAVAAAEAELAAGPVLLRPSAAQTAADRAGSSSTPASGSVALPNPVAAALAYALAQHACLPLYISTTFRPIPPLDEIAAMKEAAARPRLIADLKRLRTMDRARMRAEGKMVSTRLWRAGARHHRIFFEEPDATLVRARRDGEQLENAIAHKQFLTWREQQLRNQSLAVRAAMEAAEKEKEAKDKADAAAAAAADPFNPFKVYGNPTGEPTIAERRYMVKLVGGDDAPQQQQRSKAEQVAEELRQLRAIRERSAGSAPGQPLPPLQSRSAAHVPPPLPGMGVRKKAQLQPLQRPTAAVAVMGAAEHKSPAGISSAPESSHSVSDGAAASGLASPSGSGAHLTLLPGSVTAADGERSDDGGGGPATRDERALLDDADDFVSESRSLHSIHTPRDKNMFMLTPR